MDKFAFLEKFSRKLIKYCEKNDLAKVNEYLSLGVDVNTVNESEDHNERQAALMVASKNGHSAIVSRLVEVPRIDINYEDEEGWTAAHFASNNDEAECVKILEETFRVEWNKKDTEGKTPLYLAMEAVVNEYEDIVKIKSQY